MAENPAGKKADPRTVYADIIDLPHWQSPTRSRMSLYDRAAQFSPFAALTGYDEMVEETARYTGERIELDEDEKALIDARLREAVAMAEAHRKAVKAAATPVAATAENDAGRGIDPIAITYFKPDLYKEGGFYVTVNGFVKKYDPVARVITLADGCRISVDDVYSVELRPDGARDA